LGGRVADSYIGVTTIKFGQVAVLFFGVSTSLFISASQLFLKAKEFDVFSIPQRYIELLKDDCEINNKNWDDFEDGQTQHCRVKEQLARKFYNSAIFMMFGGLFFSILPYNFLIAFLVSGLGIALEVWQMLKRM